MEPIDTCLTLKPDAWNCGGSSTSQVKSSRSTGRCGPSCTTIRSIASSTFRLKRPSGAANSSWEATATCPAINIVPTSNPAVSTRGSRCGIEAARPRYTSDHRIAQATHGEVLRACLTEGLCEPVVEPLECRTHDPSTRADRQRRGQAGGRPQDTRSAGADRQYCGKDQAALGRWITLSHWCDDTFGTQIVRQINDQLIKWCEAFLDEGHAAWTDAGERKGIIRRLESDRVS